MTRVRRADDDRRRQAAIGLQCFLDRTTLPQFAFIDTDSRVGSAPLDSNEVAVDQARIERRVGGSYHDHHHIHVRRDNLFDPRIHGIGSREEGAPR